MEELGIKEKVMALCSSVIREDAQWLAASAGLPMERLAGKTLLLTGACGFLGAYVLDVLAHWNRTQARPCRILAMDNHLVGLPERVQHLRDRPDIRFLDQDLTRPYLPDEPIHAIFHAAGVASPTFYRRYPLETLDVNVGGTRQLLELCRTQPVERMLHLSTSEIYGDPTPDAIPTREDYRGLVSCTGPRACYDESKRLSETLCALYHQLHGVPVAVGRPFNVYGPGQRIDDRRIVPDLMQAALRGGPLVLLSDHLGHAADPAGGPPRGGLQPGQRPRGGVHAAGGRNPARSGRPARPGPVSPERGPALPHRQSPAALPGSGPAPGPGPVRTPGPAARGSGPHLARLPGGTVMTPTWHSAFQEKLP
jgi:nucleoside-diphosphate-sugar epimerase